MPHSPRLYRLIAAALVAISATTVSVHAYADDPGTAKKKADAQVKTAQSDLDDTSGELITAQATLTKTTADVGAAQTALGTQQATLTTAESTSTRIAGDLSAAQLTETKNAGAIKTTARAKARTTTLVGGIARRSYEAGGLGKFALTLKILGSDGPDIASQMSTAGLLLRQQNSVLTKLAGEQATQKVQAVTLSATRRRVAGLKVQADNAVTAATTARNNAQTAQNTLLILQKAQTGARNALAKQKTVEVANLKTHTEQAAKWGAILRARAIALAKVQKRAADTATRQAATTLAPSGPSPQRAASKSAVVGSRGSGFFSPPMPLSSIGSVFGFRISPVDGVNRLHAGVDFPFACGTAVVAAADGTVVSASSDNIAGNNIVVDHGYVRGQNLATQYEHLSRFVVRSGAVTRGQLIGYSGTTGRSTGCHLHFAVLDNGSYVDPLIWLR